MRGARPPLWEYGRSIGDAVAERVGRAASRVQEESPLPADILESEAEFLVVFDAPGATATDVQVQLVENTVEVRVDRFRAFREGYEMVFPGRGLELDGRVELPPDASIDEESTRAELKDSGALHVVLPKADESNDEEA